MGKIKYTKENLQYLNGCISVREALEKLGLKRDGGNKRLRSLLMSILKENDSYKGQGHHKGNSSPKKDNDVFFTNGDAKRSTWAVRNALFNRGIKNKVCESCQLSEWQGKHIPLEVHHKDGNKYNNELVNLEILCPNCHYFTGTYKTKNRNAPVVESIHVGLKNLCLRD